MSALHLLHFAISYNQEMMDLFEGYFKAEPCWKVIQMDSFVLILTNGELLAWHACLHKGTRKTYGVPLEHSSLEENTNLIFLFSLSLVLLVT